MIAWPETLIATPAASQDDLNLVTQYNLLLEASMELEQANTALDVRVTDLEETGQGETRGLKIRQSRISPNTDVIIEADQLRLSTGAVITDVDVIADLGDEGAGGLDTGTAVANTWYYFFVINDSTDVLPDRGLISEAASPLLPDGYDRVSEPLLLMLTDSTSHLHPFTHQWPEGVTLVSSNEHDMTVGPLAFVDLAGVGSSWGDVDLSAISPPGASQVLVRVIGISGFGTDCVLYGRPTWGGDVGGSGAGYGRRMFHLYETDTGESEAYWIELDDDGLFSFLRSEDAFVTLRVFPVGWKYQP